jgi:TPR repeat protein
MIFHYNHNKRRIKMSEGNAVGRFEFAMSWMTGKDKNIENAKEWLEKALDVVDGDDIAEKQDAINRLWAKLDSYSGLTDDERNVLSSVFGAFVSNRDMKSSALENMEKVKDFLLILDSARKGDVKNQTELASMYCFALDGVIKDYKLAFYWFKKSAEQGDKEAQFRVGECYQKGNGVEEDIEEAKKWYQKAASQGLKVAKDQLEELS